jgi:hypothetical protein
MNEVEGKMEDEDDKVKCLKERDRKNEILSWEYACEKTNKKIREII